MSFINSLSTSGATQGERGERGIAGVAGERGIAGDTGLAGKDAEDGATGEAGEDGKDSTTQGPRGYTGERGERGNDAWPDPAFNSVNVNGTVSCGNSLKVNGYRTLRSNGIQLNYYERDITEIGRKFTGIIVLSALGNDLSSGVFAVSNNSNSVGGDIKELSIQGDYSDSNKRVGFRYVLWNFKGNQIQYAKLLTLLDFFLRVPLIFEFIIFIYNKELCCMPILKKKRNVLLIS